MQREDIEPQLTFASFWRAFGKLGVSEKNIGWDGMFKGKPLKTDLYKYRIDVYDIFGKHYNYLGDVHLMQ